MKNWVKINDESRGNYSTNSQINLTVAVANIAAGDVDENNTNKKE